MTVSRLPLNETIFRRRDGYGRGGRSRQTRAVVVAFGVSQGAPGCDSDGPGDEQEQQAADVAQTVRDSQRRTHPGLGRPTTCWLAGAVDS